MNRRMCSCQGREKRKRAERKRRRAEAELWGREKELDPAARKITGDNDGEVPPVPIPNTVVKLSSAESTWLDTAREDRSLPVPPLGSRSTSFFRCSDAIVYMSIDLDR